MPPTIKGISIEFEGKTTGLDKAVADVNKTARDLQSELKQVDKLLRFDPENTELLAQKQKLLADTIANSQEKLDRLKAAEQQVDEQFKKGDIKERQYRAFQREVAKAEQDLRRFEGRLESTEKKARDLGETVKAAGEKVQGIGEKVSSAGEMMSVGITAPVLAAGGAMLKGAMDAQTAQGRLQASLAITEEAAEDLEVVAKQVWENGFGESIDDVNRAIVSVRQNIGWLTGTELKDVTEGAMTIADIFEQDVTDVTRVAGVMIKNFGVSGVNALDIIAGGFKLGGDFSGELLDTLREYSPQFASLGLNAEQSMGMLIEGARQGAWNLDKVGDAAKEFNIRAQDGSKTTADGFKVLGLDAEKMGSSIAKGGADAQKAFIATITALAGIKDPLKQNQAGVALFGTQWEDVRSKVVTAMAAGVEWSGEFKGALDETKKAAYDNNPWQAIEKAVRELQNAIGPVLLPIASMIRDTVVPAVKSLVGWFKGLGPEGQKVALGIAGIVAAIGPLLVGLGPVISTIGSLMVAMSTAGITIGAIAAPIGIAIAVIAGLAAIAYLVYKNWDSVKIAVMPIIQGMVAFFTQQFGVIKAWIDQNLPLMRAAFTNVMTAIQAIWSVVWPILQAVVVPIIEHIKNVISQGLQLILNTFKLVMQIITGDWKGAWETVKSIIGNALSLVWSLINLWLFGKVLGAFKGIGSAIVNFVRAPFSSLAGIVSRAMGALKEAASAGVGDTIGFFAGLPEKILGALKNLPDDLLSVGKNLITSLGNGISSMGKWIEELISGFVKSKIPDVVKKALGIKSPSRVFMGIGKYIPQGLGIGIQSSVGYVTSAVKDMLSPLNISPAMALAGLPSIGSGSSGQSAAPVSALNVTVTGNSIANDYDVERIGEQLYALLKRKGVIK